MAKKKVKKATRRSPQRGARGRLSDGQSAWSQSVPRHIGGSLPVGEFVGKIQNAVIEENQSGTLQVVWDVEVIEGKYKGRSQRKWSNLDSKDQMDWLKGDLQAIEVTPPDDINDLGDALGEAIGLEIRFEMRQGRDEYVNMNFIERLEGSVAEATKDDDPGYTVEDIKAMSEDELTTLAKEYGLDPDEFSWEDLEKELISIC